MNTTLESPAPVAATRSFAQRFANALHDAGYLGIDHEWTVLAIQERMDAVAEVIEEAGLRDADILKFIAAKGKSSGIPGCVLTAYEGSYTPTCAWMASVKDAVDSSAPTCHGDTADEAIANLKTALSSASRIAAKRERAAKLLAEAEALELRGAA